MPIYSIQLPRLPPKQLNLTLKISYQSCALHNLHIMLYRYENFKLDNEHTYSIEKSILEYMNVDEMEIH